MHSQLLEYETGKFLAIYRIDFILQTQGIVDDRMKDDDNTYEYGV